MTCLSLLLIAALAGGLAARQGGSAPQVRPDAQIPPVTFKVEVNYVEVDASVTDAAGRFVADLRKEDFEVFEDGKRQEVTSFGLVDIPVERADAPLFVPTAVEPDTVTNERPFEGRLYLIVLDDIHTNVMHSGLVKAAARRFVERQMGANDIAAVVTIRGTDAAQEFTGNKRLLLTAIDKFMGRALRSASMNKREDYNTRIRNSPVGGDTKPRDMEEQERAYNARSTLSALRQLSDFMANVRGRRKAMVFFSEGVDYDVSDVFNNPAAGDVRQETFEAIAAATRANVSIYSIDPRGLSASSGLTADDAGGVAADADPNLRLGAEGVQDELRMAQDSLNVLAEETGGFAAINTNDFNRVFDRIRQENSTYYVLGYYPTNERRDGKVRKIEVRVKRAGLDVKSRKGYVAPRGKAPSAKVVEAKEGTSPVLRETLNSPLPISGLRLSASAAAFKGVGANASVLLVVQSDGRDLRFTEKDGRFDGGLEVSVIAIDKQGKVKNGVRQTIAMPLRPESYKVVARQGLRVVCRIDLPAGQYQLRVGALDQGSGRTGSVHYDLEVPAFSQGPLSMSGLVLTSTRARSVPTPGVSEDEVRKALDGPPTVAREFQADEEVGLLAEVYDNHVSTPHGVDIVTTLRGDDGREVFRHADERSSAELQGSRGGYGYTARVPLKGLAPGLYLLRVEARSRLGKGAAVAREVQIRIVA